jgi:sentrin-specific protease 8
MSAASTKFLNYKRYDLNTADATILERGGWLTSDSLNFAFASLCNKDGRLDHDSFGFLNPLSIMMLTHGDADTTASIVEDCDLLSKDLIFIPLNDASATNTHNRGTHWRLLIFCKSSKSFHLYDSGGSSSANGQTDLGTQGNVLVERLAPFLVNAPKISLGGFAKRQPTTCRTVVEPCPRQQNGYDCGMYVFCLVELLCFAFSTPEHGLQSPSDLVDKIQRTITPDYVTEQRLKLFQKAVALRKEWQNVKQEEGTGERKA